MKIIITHGSGGPGTAEWNASSFFEEMGYDVEVKDYFVDFDIRSLRWCDSPEHKQDAFDITYKEMFDSIQLPEDEDLIHIGFSLGGFFGLYKAEKFKKNYLFYPGVQGITQELLEKDYSNTSVIFGSEDKGQSKYNAFKEQCKNPPLAHYSLKDAHHAFMVSNVDMEFPMTRYNTIGKIMDEQEFAELKPNHKFMSERYGYSNEKTILRSHHDYRNQYLQIIGEEISEAFPRI